jgi:hypothetical protein
MGWFSGNMPTAIDHLLNRSDPPVLLFSQRVTPHAASLLTCGVPPTVLAPGASPYQWKTCGQEWKPRGESCPSKS